MLKINRKLSKKGFTLIELMVAIAILGIASIGIFQAFSVGFQSMADAKYRTVATNIAQEKLEEVKNSVKVAYPYYSVETQVISDTTYTVIVATNSQEDNLEQVYVTVSWHDRQGNEKNVQLETLVYDLQVDYAVTPPDVGRIHLSADSTVITCCVEGETSAITAELFNTADPEDRVPSGIPVSFTVNNGVVDTEFSVTDSMGKAYTNLTINDLGPATVTARSGLVDSDPLEVTCTPEVNEIALSADPSAIIPGSSSTITATVTDTCGDVISEEVAVEFTTDVGNDIYFLVGGNKVNNTIVTTINSIATIDLYIDGTDKTATVTGTITPVEGEPISDSTTVICTTYSISVTAVPASINPGGDNDTSTITAVLIHSGGTPAAGETISFATDSGTLSTSTANTDGDGKAIVTLSSMIGGDIATITASYVILGLGTIISDTTTVQCTEYVINIVANPDKVIPGSPSTITATLTNYEGNPASSRRVDFYTTKGLLSDTSVYTNSSGIAVTTLTLNTVGDIANVSASYGYAINTVNVECIEFMLELSANPESISPGESSVITALLTNYSGTPQSGQTITFNTNTGILSTTNPVTSGTTVTAVTNSIGEAVVHLTLNTAGTTAIITAEYDVVEDTVSVECSESIYITNLYDPPIISHWQYGSYSDDSISFSIALHGGPLVVDKVKIEWQTNYNGYPSRYRNIWIRISGGNWSEIYDMNHANNGDIETLNLNSPYTLAADQTFEISVNFSYTIRHKHVIFTLNPDDPHAEENYQVDFYTPY